MTRWKPIFNGDYMVSDEGEVWSNKTNRMLSQSLDTKGYPCVKVNGKRVAVHILVAKAFIPNLYDKDTVNHKNEDKTDNRVENLEWMTDYENNRYGSHDFNAAETKRVRAANGEYDKAKVFGAKAVIQYDLEGNKIAEFESCAAAAKATGGNPDGISLVARGKQRTSGGFIWKFKFKDAPR